MVRSKAVPDGTPRITAAVCCDADGELCQRAIRSLRQQSLPTESFEIVVVGNREAMHPSRDGAGDGRQSDSLRWVETDDRDRATLRTIALAEARAPLIAFLDCRAIAETAWLASFCRTFDQFGTAARMVGGRTTPLWPAPRPGWLDDRLLIDLGLVDLGGDIRFLEAGERIADTNIAFRAADAAAFLAPNGAVAARGGACTYSRETIRQLLPDGAEGLYDPFATVEYLILPDDLSQASFRSRAAWRAVSDLMQSGAGRPDTAVQRWIAAKDYFFTCAPSERTIRALLLDRDDPERVRDQMAAVYNVLFSLLSGVSEASDDQFR